MTHNEASNQSKGFPDGSVSERIRLQCRSPGFNPWVGKIPWRRKWQPIPVFLPGKSQGQRSLAPYSPWHHKQLDTTEHGVAAAASNIFSSITISKAQEL